MVDNGAGLQLSSQHRAEAVLQVVHAEQFVVDKCRTAGMEHMQDTADKIVVTVAETTALHLSKQLKY